MRNLYNVFLGLTLLSLVVTPAVAQGPVEVQMATPPMAATPGMMWMGDGPGMMLPLLLRGADLTDQQQAQINTIMATRRGTLRPLFQQLRTAHDELAAKLLTPGEVQAGDLTSQLQHMAQLREQLSQEGLAVMLEVRKVLTPEQLAKVAQRREKMKALHREMRGLFNEKVPAPGADEPEGDVLFFQHP